MHFIKLYQPLIGTKASFLQSFEGDAMRTNASLFWSKLDDASIVFFILTIVAAIGVVVYYYIPFNNQPGRHYLPKNFRFRNNNRYCNGLCYSKIKWNIDD